VILNIHIVILKIFSKIIFNNSTNFVLSFNYSMTKIFYVIKQKMFQKKQIIEKLKSIVL